MRSRVASGKARILSVGKKVARESSREMIAQVGQVSDLIIRYVLRQPPGEGTPASSRKLPGHSILWSTEPTELTEYTGKFGALCISRVRFQSALLRIA